MNSRVAGCADRRSPAQPSLGRCGWAGHRCRWARELGTWHELADLAVTREGGVESNPKAISVEENRMKNLVKQSQNLWRAGGDRWRPVVVAGGGGGGVLLLVDRRSLQAAIFASARIERLLLAFFFGRVHCL